MNGSAPLAESGFALLTLFFYGLLVTAFRKALIAAQVPAGQVNAFVIRIVAALSGWLAAVAALSLTGFLSDFSTTPPRMLIVLAVPLVAIILFLRSPLAKIALTTMPMATIIRLQVFRVFVELLLWLLYLDMSLPVQMTFEGRNFDILAGLSAPIIAWLVTHKKISNTIVIAWNIICLLLLANIVTIAILSMPTKFQYFTNEPYNTIVATFPIVLLPAFLVPLAYGLHFLSLRKLMNKP